MLEDIKSMRALKNTTENYSTEISFEKSKGNSIDNFMVVYNQILELQQDLVTLYDNTAEALKNARKSFINADGKAAEYFEQVGGK